MQVLIALFLLFLVMSAPTEAGDAGRSMASWVASGWEPVSEFLDSLFNGEE